MYDGIPDLKLTAEMVAAGGGAAGKNAPAALAYLTKTYGAADVDGFFRTFTYAVNDSLKYATAKKIALPAVAVPSGGSSTKRAPCPTASTIPATCSRSWSRIRSTCG
jgi:hypothetical protein